MDDNDTKELPAVTRQNRIEWLASPDGAAPLDMENVMEEFLLRFFEVTAKHEDCEGFSWRTDGEYAPVTIFVNCNDLFWWATGDSETVTLENIAVLEQCYADLQAADPDDCAATCYGQSLFASRVRKMRPQGCCYPGNKKLWPLYDACGPERAIDIGNPYTPERYHAKKAAERAAKT